MARGHRAAPAFSKAYGEGVKGAAFARSVLGIACIGIVRAKGSLLLLSTPQGAGCAQSSDSREDAGRHLVERGTPYGRDGEGAAIAISFIEYRAQGARIVAMPQRTRERSTRRHAPAIAFAVLVPK